MAHSRLLRPQNILLFYLIFLYGAALVSAQDFDFMVQSLLLFGAITFGYFLPYFFQRVRKIPSRMRFENAGITILILTLLADQRIGIEWAAALGLITALIKIFLRFQGKPVLNPATAGLAVLGVLGIYETWWGVSFEPRFTDFFISIAAFFTLPIAGYVAHRYNKLPIVVSLLVAFAGVSVLLTGNTQTTLLLLLEGTLLFFALVMASEPLTSPVQKKEQIVFGAIVGTLVAVFLAQAWMLTYLAPLLLANAVFTLYKWQQQRLILAKVQAAKLQASQK